MSRRSASRTSLRPTQRARILGAFGITVVALLVIALVPPVRFAATRAALENVRAVAGLFLPGVGGFEELRESSLVVAADGTELGTIGEEHRETVPLERIPEHVRQAVLAVEDRTFHQHPGIDPLAVLRAGWRNLTTDDLQGGSTITQQLAKAEYAGPDQTLLRKTREALYAVELERAHDKDRLLERYLNQVYFGQGAHGIGVASEVFFGVPVEDLGIEQAATLSGKIRAPEALDPWQRPEAVRARRNRALADMREFGVISEARARAARAEPLGVRPGPPDPIRRGPAPHFLDYVRREAEGLEALGATTAARRHALYVTGGYRIETTLDPRALEAAEEAARTTLGEPDDPTTAVASVVPGDGAIRVLFGGLDPDLDFGVASRGRRQAGSSFKPYAYLAMLREGIDPRSRFGTRSPMSIDDCPGEPWTVRNYGGFSDGPMRVDAALVRSVNVVFAQVAEEIGPEAVREVAVRAGIEREAVTPPVCAMALGGLHEGVSPLEQAAAFATFAAGGEHAPPYAIGRITDRDGDVVYERDPRARRVFGSREAGVLNAALERVVEEGTGRSAAIGRPIAGKTGTTDDHGDAWFVGFAPQLATAVWVGHPEGRIPMTDVHGRRVTGGSFPALIFARYMSEALEDEPAERIPTASPDELGLQALNTPSPTPSPSPSPSPSPTPSPSPSPTPTSSPSPTPSPTPSPSPTPERTAEDETTD